MNRIRTKPPRPPVIGWREHVAFPQWRIRAIEAKIDTGARTSAIHVDNIRELPGGQVTFEVILSRKKPRRRVPVTARIRRVTRIRLTSGVAQQRYVVATAVRIGPVRKIIELSLVCRKHMICRLLLGRTALEDFLVDASRKYVFDPPPSRKNSRGEVKT